MEREYKWKIPQETLAALADYLHGLQERLSHETLHMAAVYYDTPDDLVYRNGAALRLRKENEKTVCCMKRTLKKEGAQALREEYETEADSLQEGLLKLPDAGAPRDLCIFLSHQQFRELGRTDFVRNCYLLAPEPAFTAEFALDVGALGCADHMEPFEEIELELKSGDAAAFQAYADALEQRFRLIPQKRSKLARAIQTAQDFQKYASAPIRNVIFDIGLVLLQFDLLGFMTNLFGAETGQRLKDAMWGSPAWDELDRSVLPVDAVMELFIADHPEYAQEIRTVFAKMGEIPKEMPYTRKWIAELKEKGFKVYYLSNYSTFLRDECPQVLAFTQLTDGGVFSCDVQCVKPDPAIFAEICRKYDLKPEECLFIDDNSRNVAAARDFGMRAVQFESFEQQYPEITALLARHGCPSENGI